MPLSALDNVPCSEMWRTSHTGAGTAGNKSALTFRSDIGVPGYSGYCPGWASIPVAVKGSKHLGRQVDEATRLQATQRAALHLTKTEYTNRFQADPSAYVRPTKTGGGYWFEQRSQQAAGNSPAFLATSTYQAEVAAGEGTAAAQLERSQGLASTLVGYETARKRATTAPDLGSSLSSSTALVSTGDLLGYKTQYRTMTAAVAAKAQLQATLAASGEGAQLVADDSSAPEIIRHAVMPHAGEPPFEGASTYKRDFGANGQDPMLRCPPSGQLVSQFASTRPLNEGTAKASPHVVGYTGFVPATEVETFARQQELGFSSRRDFKVGMLPHTLDQFSRSRVPGITTYKPRGGAGATTLQPAHGPTSLTTQGFVNNEVLKRGPQPRDGNVAINSRAGIMSFFQGGGEMISDNGESDAQKYYVRLRPLEGRFKA